MLMQYECNWSKYVTNTQNKNTRMATMAAILTNANQN